MRKLYSHRRKTKLPLHVSPRLWYDYLWTLESNGSCGRKCFPVFSIVSRKISIWKKSCVSESRWSDLVMDAPEKTILAVSWKTFCWSELSCENKFCATYQSSKVARCCCNDASGWGLFFGAERPNWGMLHLENVEWASWSFVSTICRARAVSARSGCDQNLFQMSVLKEFLKFSNICFGSGGSQCASTIGSYFFSAWNND